MKACFWIYVPEFREWEERQCASVEIRDHARSVWRSRGYATAVQHDPLAAAARNLLRHLRPGDGYLYDVSDAINDVREAVGRAQIGGRLYWACRKVATCRSSAHFFALEAELRWALEEANNDQH